MKAWPPGKHNLHEGQEMEESRVRVPPHSAPTHPHYIQSTPSQDGSQQEQELPLRSSQEQAQLHPPLGELHWGGRTEERLEGILLQATVPRLEPI